MIRGWVNDAIQKTLGVMDSHPSVKRLVSQRIEECPQYMERIVKAVCGISPLGSRSLTVPFDQISREKSNHRSTLRSVCSAAVTAHFGLLLMNQPAAVTVEYVDWLLHDLNFTCATFDYQVRSVDCDSLSGPS
jgi:hypothetical protein